MSRPTHSPGAAPAAAFSPNLARMSTVHARTEPVAYDCVKLIFCSVRFCDLVQRVRADASERRGCRRSRLEHPLRHITVTTTYAASNSPRSAEWTR